WHVTLALGAHMRLDATDAGFDGVGVNRAFVQRPFDAFAQFVLVVGLRRAVLLDNARINHFRCFKSSTALATARALPTPAHLAAIGRQARIQHAGIVVTANRTMHGQQPPTSARYALS